MSYSFDGTIAAISSAVGPAGRMIVRVSGPAAQRIARRICDDLPVPQHARRTVLRFSDLAVPAIACLFVAPRSYTSQDLVEFHIPGNPLLARLLLDAIVQCGARHAEAGEFTARAYLSGRIDLAEAEGVAATIAAHGEQELRAARQLLSGELSRRLRGPMDRLVGTLALVEAGIDFSDEDVSFLSADEVDRHAREVDAVLEELLRASARFEPLTREPSFVLIGRPNAGKSTLLNVLAGHLRAVVSPVAGTTRDVLSAEVKLRRGIVRVLDAAGFEEFDRCQAAGDQSAPTGPVSAPAEPREFDPAQFIAWQMQQRARRALEEADYIVLVQDSTDIHALMGCPREPDLVVRTKADLSGDPSAVSATTGAGLDDLRDRLDRLAFGQTPASPTLALNARHRKAIEEARSALARGGEAARSGGGAELVALELREALDALGSALGQVTPDDVIGRIFATFCIGK